MGESRLVLFGGRSSETGVTLGATCLATITWPSVPSGRALARWDELRFGHDDGLSQPGARCYHTAVRWGSRDRDETPSMLVFGGAGESADGSGAGPNSLHSDSWCLRLPTAAQRGAQPARWEWERVARAPRDNDDGDAAPAPRSSHVCAVWADGGGAAVLHGGLGNNGVMSDAWTLRVEPGARWARLETRGAPAPRAHHIAAIVRDTLLVFSGQNEQLLTVETLCSLHLPTATWSTAVPLPARGPAARIDAAGGALRLSAAGGLCGGGGVELGVLVFGGMGGAFEFEPPSPWLVRPAAGGFGGVDEASGGVARASEAGEVHAVESELLLADTPASPRAAPGSRACAALATDDGLRAFAFGGFDGQHDLDELWCLSLLPGCLAFADDAKGRAATGAGRVRSAAAATQAAGLSHGSSARSEDGLHAIGTAEFRLRRAAQVKELQSIRSASGQSYMPIHLRVWHVGPDGSLPVDVAASAAPAEGK
jgi:hypothetical protein